MESSISAEFGAFAGSPGGAFQSPRRPTASSARRNCSAPAQPSAGDASASVSSVSFLSSRAALQCGDAVACSRASHKAPPRLGLPAPASPFRAVHKQRFSLLLLVVASSLVSLDSAHWGESVDGRPAGFLFPAAEASVRFTSFPSQKALALRFGNVSLREMVMHFHYTEKLLEDARGLLSRIFRVPIRAISFLQLRQDDERPDHASLLTFDVQGKHLHDQQGQFQEYLEKHSEGLELVFGGRKVSCEPLAQVLQPAVVEEMPEPQGKSFVWQRPGKTNTATRARARFSSEKEKETVDTKGHPRGKGIQRTARRRRKRAAEKAGRDGEQVSEKPATKHKISPVMRALASAGYTRILDNAEHLIWVRVKKTSGVPRHAQYGEVNQMLTRAVKGVVQATGYLVEPEDVQVLSLEEDRDARVVALGISQHRGVQHYLKALKAWLRNACGGTMILQTALGAALTADCSIPLVTVRETGQPLTEDDISLEEDSDAASEAAPKKQKEMDDKEQDRAAMDPSTRFGPNYVTGAHNATEPGTFPPGYPMAYPWGYMPPFPPHPWPSPAGEGDREAVDKAVKASNAPAEATAEEAGGSSGVGVKIGIVAGCLVVGLLIVLVVWCVWRLRKKDEKALAEKQREIIAERRAKNRGVATYAQQ
ncbi:conserved hypothetical protein [Neospora caninum Liverpool]|uniref:Transmembrane protein n=1 Tax=Neospora caninum (strain Liverpool) TaxID=572307 RepID=F0VDD3_NEOCL|nr:conserved hypothetical protein [Neospora caninum Liverpool]CBZ51648.1 conserved hypothetical protein [Neospora caninum Liverpool]CEL65602.1 TPA: hypothetical protein BN1204_014420 [Neospora caninum Liverpool]|eukprot:XP_003881681.1 conserved hypothetical protein [Neospora caninum Liverpool]